MGLVKFLVIIVLVLLVFSSIVLADHPNKVKPVKKLHPHDVPPIPTNISWYVTGFGFSVVLYNNSSSIGWSIWSNWWTIWNVLPDVPVVGNVEYVKVRW